MVGGWVWFGKGKLRLSMEGDLERHSIGVFKLS